MDNQTQINYNEFSEPGCGRYGHVVKPENLYTIPIIMEAFEDHFNQMCGDSSDIQQMAMCEDHANTDLLIVVSTLNSFLQMRFTIPLEKANTCETANVQLFNKYGKARAVNLLKQLAYIWFCEKGSGLEDIEPWEDEVYVKPEGIKFNENNQFVSVMTYSFIVYAQFKEGYAIKANTETTVTPEFIIPPELRIGVKLRMNAIDTRGAYNYG